MLTSLENMFYWHGINWKKMMDQDQTRQRQESIRPLSTVERARGLITTWEQTRREEEISLWRGGIWTPMSETPGHARVATLVWLCEEATHNAVRVPGLVPPQQQRRGRGRGLSFLLHNHPYPSLAWEEPGVGTLAITHSQIPHFKFQIHSPGAYVGICSIPTQCPTFAKYLQTPISWRVHRVRAQRWLWLKFPCALEFLCWFPTLKSILSLFNLSLNVFGMYDWNLWPYCQHESITRKRQQPGIKTI